MIKNDDFKEDKYRKESKDDFIEFVMEQIKSTEEDYYEIIDLLDVNCLNTQDIRLVILGAYLSSTWLNSEENRFFKYMNSCLEKACRQNKAILYYLLAYDIYMKYEKKYPLDYEKYLRKSILYSEHFVYNYIRLSEIVNRKEAKKLVECAIGNIEKVWDEDDVIEEKDKKSLRYENFINEFILGIDLNKYEYQELLKKMTKVMS